MTAVACFSSYASRGRRETDRHKRKELLSGLQPRFRGLGRSFPRRQSLVNRAGDSQRSMVETLTLRRFVSPPLKNLATLHPAWIGTLLFGVC